MVEKNKLGMSLFIGSEAVFFILLILAYAYFHNIAASSGANTSAKVLDPLTTGFFSLFLFSSSFTVWRAGKSMEKENFQSMRLWLIVTILLGAIFLFGQGLEWSHLFNEGTTISANLFGTTFFTLTGFHGMHVIIGLIMLGVLVGMAFAGNFRSKRSAAVEVISLYWHFVDVVWVVIFSVVYLTLLIK
jgi:heme/copper-type cytochrome/quinol oxidase subunit 3